MLKTLPDGWFSYGDGTRWRCRAPAYLCEVQDEGNMPSLARAPGIAERLRRIRAFYLGRLKLGALDRMGTGLDILVANAMTESYGTVPSPLALNALERQLDKSPELPLDIRLDHLLRDMGAAKTTRWLVRLEPGYRTPATTPNRVSVGAHHMLLSTATTLPSQRKRSEDKNTALRHQVLKLAADSLHSAQLAVEYLNGKQALHQNHLPLIAATYNAGSPRVHTRNAWRLVQYGEHIDRWIAYYNASREIAGVVRDAPPVRAVPAPVPSGPADPSAEATMLSAHFSLAELVASDTARKLGISNQPSPLVVENLRRLAALLEDIRALLGGHPLGISSAYRCPELNRAVGSKNTSLHMQGLAADFVCPRFGSPLQISRAIAASAIPFDQIIHEFGRWVHIGLALPGRPLRRQQLTIDRHGTHAGLININ